MTAFNEDLDRDHPLVLRYNPPKGWLQLLALPSASARHEQARAQIAAIAIDKARHQQPWISYSRNHNHYSRRGGRYDEHPELYRPSIIPPSVDALATAGYLESIIAPRNPNCGFQSVFRATRALTDALGDAPPPVAKPKQRALVQLRDEQKQLIDFTDTEKTRRMQRHLVTINEAIGAQKVELPAGIGERHDDLLAIDNSYINLGHTAYFRIFNVDFGNGGRMYGHWTQSLPKAIRKQLTINGESVAEPDYSAHHLRILYALDGLQPPDDSYDIDGWDRDIAKLAVLILINAKTLASAIGAIVYRCVIPRDDAARLIEVIRRKHRPIERHFHSGAGLRLQRIDSDMAVRVVIAMTRRSVPVLPIHDSFLAPARLEGSVREQMDEAFLRVLSRERAASRIRVSQQRLKPETSYTMVVAGSSGSYTMVVAVVAVVASLPLPCPGLFLLRPVCFPFEGSLGAAEFFDDRRRITKLGQLAVLDAIRRRGIRQEDLANLAAVSRPALANILAGRFGASPQTAERIAEIIALTPAFERQPFLPGLAA